MKHLTMLFRYLVHVCAIFKTLATHPGGLSIACALDVNNKMLPIAYNVVENKRYDTWCWFFQLLLHYVLSHLGRMITG